MPNTLVRPDVFKCVKHTILEAVESKTYVRHEVYDSKLYQIALLLRYLTDINITYIIFEYMYTPLTLFRELFCPELHTTVDLEDSHYWIFTACNCLSHYSGIEDVNSTFSFAVSEFCGMVIILVSIYNDVTTRDRTTTVYVVSNGELMHWNELYTFSYLKNKWAHVETVYGNPVNLSNDYYMSELFRHKLYVSAFKDPRNFWSLRHVTAGYLNMDAYSDHVSYPEMSYYLEDYFNPDISNLIVDYMDFELTVFLASSESNFLKFFEQLREECGNDLYTPTTADRILSMMFYNSIPYI